ncbi:hypothetical protein [Pyruvatibacter sp.]|uniref:hypothetical protein n=1 Tax=Pyruvatibacter sp. TaxID=1981328 RepID=UPI0032EC1547
MIDLAIGILAGFFLGVFLMGLVVPPGWPSEVVLWAPVVAPTVAILVAAGAIYHAERNHRRDRYNSKKDQLPVIFRALVDCAERTSGFLDVINSDGDDPHKKFKRAVLLGYSGEPTNFSLIATGLGQFSYKCAARILTAYHTADRFEAVIKVAAEGGMETSKEMYEHITKSGAKIVLNALYAYLAVREDFPDEGSFGGSSILGCVRDVVRHLDFSVSSDDGKANYDDALALANFFGEREKLVNALRDSRTSYDQA